MLKIDYTKQFKKDFKLVLQRGWNVKEMLDIIEKIQKGKTLPKESRDHKLENSRNYKNCRDCHIKSDWVLIYMIIKKENILRLVRTGSHGDLF